MPKGGVMRLFSTGSTATTAGGSQTAQEKRGKGRIPAGVISCELGEVVDLSESGVRIKRRGGVDLKEGGTTMLTLRGPAQTITCPCRVAWVKKAGWFHVDLGLEFLDMSEGFSRSLRQLSMASIAMQNGPEQMDVRSRHAA